MEIESYISEALKLDYTEIIKYSNKLLDELSRQPVKKSEEYQLLKLKSVVEEFVFFLQTGQRPRQFNELAFQKTKVIVEHLIALQQLRPSSLEIYQ